MLISEDRPVDMVMGAKGGGSAPKLSNMEQQAIGKQTEIADWQWQLAKDQHAMQSSLLPFFLDEAGYTYAEHEGGEEILGLRDRQQKVEQEIQKLFDRGASSQEEWHRLMDPLQAEKTHIAERLTQLNVPENFVGYGGKGYTLSKKDDPLEELNRQVATEAGARQLRALRGELDVDPAVQQDLERQKEELHAQLQQRLGPGYANTDAGMRALREFERNENTVRYQVRHGEMSAADAIRHNAESAYRGAGQQRAANLQGYSHFPASASATASGAAQNFGHIGDRLGSQRMQAHGINEQRKASQADMWGSLAGGVVSAGAGIGAAAILV